MSADPLTLGVLPGDGIGPEIVTAAVRVVEAALADAAQVIERAVTGALDAGTSTPDLCGTATTAQFTDAVLRCLAG